MTTANNNLYPRERCKHLRASCVAIARKHRDAGRKAVMIEWLGYAVYWSTRARTGLEPDKAQAVAHERGKRFAVRSPQAIAARLTLAVAGMGWQEPVIPLVPRSDVSAVNAYGMGRQS